MSLKRCVRAYVHENYEVCMLLAEDKYIPASNNYDDDDDDDDDDNDDDDDDNDNDNDDNDNDNDDDNDNEAML